MRGGSFQDRAAQGLARHVAGFTRLGRNRPETEKQTSAIADAMAKSPERPVGDRSGVAGPSDTPVRNGHLIGYARVSTRAQDLALQLDALEHAGCERVYQDVGSGSIRSRPQLDACLEQLLPGDTLVVWRLDRLGRSLRHLIDVIAGLQERETAFRSLRESIDTTTATGRLQLHLFAALAEFERDAARGISLVMPRVRLSGRPRLVTAEKLAAAQAMRAQQHTMAEISSALGISRATLYRHLALDAERNDHAA